MPDPVEYRKETFVYPGGGGDFLVPPDSVRRDSPKSGPELIHGIADPPATPPLEFDVYKTIVEKVEGSNIRSLAGPIGEDVTASTTSVVQRVTVTFPAPVGTYRVGDEVEVRLPCACPPDRFQPEDPS